MLSFSEKESPSENREGHWWDERRGHQLDSSGDSQCHEYVHFLSPTVTNNYSLNREVIHLVISLLIAMRIKSDLNILCYRQGFP